MLKRNCFLWGSIGVLSVAIFTIPNIVNATTIGSGSFTLIGVPGSARVNIPSTVGRISESQQDTPTTRTLTTEYAYLTSPDYTASVDINANHLNGAWDVNNQVATFDFSVTSPDALPLSNSHASVDFYGSLDFTGTLDGSFGYDTSYTGMRGDATEDQLSFITQMSIWYYETPGDFYSRVFVYSDYGTGSLDNPDSNFRNNWVTYYNMDGTHNDSIRFDYGSYGEKHWYVSYDFMAYGDSQIGAPSAPVPEPATMLLFGTGLVGLVGSRLRKKKK